MKKLNIFLIISLCLFGFYSCDDDSNRITLNENDFVAPVFTQEVTQGFEITEDTDLTEVIGSWSWTKSEFGVQSPSRYEIEVDTLESFETFKVFTATAGTSIELTYKELNNAAMMFVKESREIKLYFRLKTSLGTAGADPVFISDTKSVAFTCLYILPLPTELYMTGADFGGWSWDAEGAVKLIPVNGVAGAFWTINYFKAGNGFKWSPDRDWGTAFGKQDTSIGFTNDGDGNAVVPADGLYMVYIDMAEKKIAIEPAKIYGIGDAFGGWSEGQYPFTVTDGKATITTTAANNVRMYAASSIATSDWWTREFNIFNGKIEYRGTGGDQAAVPVAAGAVVTLDFKTGTGTIQ